MATKKAGSRPVARKAAAAPRKKAASATKVKAAAKPQKKGGGTPQKKAAAKPQKKATGKPQKKAAVKPQKKIAAPEAQKKALAQRPAKVASQKKDRSGRQLRSGPGQDRTSPEKKEVSAFRLGPSIQKVGEANSKGKGAGDASRNADRSKTVRGKAGTRARTEGSAALNSGSAKNKSKQQARSPANNRANNQPTHRFDKEGRVVPVKPAAKLQEAGSLAPGNKRVNTGAQEKPKQRLHNVRPFAGDTRKGQPSHQFDKHGRVVPLKNRAPAPASSFIKPVQASLGWRHGMVQKGQGKTAPMQNKKPRSPILKTAQVSGSRLDTAKAQQKKQPMAPDQRRLFIPGVSTASGKPPDRARLAGSAVGAAALSLGKPGVKQVHSKQTGTSAGAGAQAAVSLARRKRPADSKQRTVQAQPKLQRSGPGIVQGARSAAKSAPIWQNKTFMPAALGAGLIGSAGSVAVQVGQSPGQPVNRPARRGQQSRPERKHGQQD